VIETSSGINAAIYVIIVVVSDLFDVLLSRHLFRQLLTESGYCRLLKARGKVSGLCDRTDSRCSQNHAAFCGILGHQSEDTER
jgi:hypothetical protein